MCENNKYSHKIGLNAVVIKNNVNKYFRFVKQTPKYDWIISKFVNPDMLSELYYDFYYLVIICF